VSLPMGESFKTGSRQTTNNHSPKLLGVGGAPAVSGVVCGALATGSDGFALGDESFAIFESSLFGFSILALVFFFLELRSVALWLRWYCSLCWLFLPSIRIV
jgi:hypothetical protein